MSIPWTLILLAYDAAQPLALIQFTPGGAGFWEGGPGALLIVPHASNGAVALSVLLYRRFSWGLWVLGSGLALLHLHSTIPDEAPHRRRGPTPTATKARSSAGRRASGVNRGARPWTTNCVSGSADGQLTD